jgi:hypothetical protein
MTTALIDLPKKSAKSFWHPESQELILTAAAMITTFEFWNAVNIRPSILTDPGYRDQYEGLKHHMNLSIAAILGISTAFALIYGRKGYLPALAAAATGATMYLWTSYELDRHTEEGILPDTDMWAESYRPMYIPSKKPTYAQAMTDFQKNRREAVMIS